MKRRIFFSTLFLLYGSLSAQCDKAVINEIKTLQGQALFDYIELTANQSFDFYGLFDDYNVDVIKNGLAKSDIKDWQRLHDCITSYLYSLQNYVNRVNYGQKFTILKEIVSKLPYYARDIQQKVNLRQLQTEIKKSIDRVAQIFQVALDLLPPLVISSSRSISDVLKSYKNNVGVAFNPDIFFAEYAKHKAYYREAGKQLTPQVIFNFLYGTNFLSNSQSFQSGTYEQKQALVSNFIYLLEQLVVLSQNRQLKWVGKNNYLTPDQIAKSREIIKALYMLFPGVEVMTLSLPNASKMPIILLADARILLIILQNFERTVDYLLKIK